MEIRFINKDEEADFLKVSAASFIWKYDPEADDKVDEAVLAAFHDGKLIAGIEIIDFECNYCGNFLKTAGIGGVCSLPESRRMGGIREIFKKFGQTAAENGYAMGFLYPFSVSYFEKFGYAFMNRMFSIGLPVENMTHIPRNTDVILYSSEHFEELSALHAKCALKENLLTLRNERNCFCENPLGECDYTYFRRNAAGEADGYIRFSIVRNKDLTVKDMYFLTPEALYGLLGFLRNYDGIVRRILVQKQYQGSPISCVADRITGVSYENDGCVAGRIYDMTKILESNAYPQKHGHFRLKSIDEFEQNSGVFDVEYQNGKAIVTRKADGDYDISLTPAAAARLLLAGEGHTAETAVYINGTEIKGNADDFFAAFAHRPTRFTDGF